MRSANRPGWSAEVELRGDIVAIDQSGEMVRIAAARMPDARVLQGDAVPLPFADGEFDRLVTCNFYGHLLDNERAAFLEEARRVSAQLVIVDAAKREEVNGEEWQERVLNDGSRHRVYKRFFGAPDLAASLERSCRRVSTVKL